MYVCVYLYMCKVCMCAAEHSTRTANCIEKFFRQRWISSVFSIDDVDLVSFIAMS